MAHPAVAPGVISQGLECLYDVAREPFFLRVVVPATVWRSALAFDCDCAPHSATNNRLQERFGVHIDDSSCARVGDVAVAPLIHAAKSDVLEFHLEGGVDLTELVAELDRE